MVVRTRSNEREKEEREEKPIARESLRTLGRGVYTDLGAWSLVFGLWSLGFGLWALGFGYGSGLADPVSEVRMSRDHRRLRVFQDAHALALAIYKYTRDFPRDEWFGIRTQMRRAAVSVPTNLVEGNARRTTRDYLKFLYIARGSAGELSYLIKLSDELGYWAGSAWNDVQQRSDAVVKQLERLIQTMEARAAAESERPGGPTRERDGRP